MIPVPAGPVTRIAAELASGFAWRLARHAWPPVRHWLLYHAYCDPAGIGLIGTCQPRDGRCTTCRRPAPAPASRTPDAA